MTILVLCTNPENGTHIAFCAEDPIIHSHSHCGSPEEAVGRLIIEHPGLTVEKCIDLDELWKVGK